MSGSTAPFQGAETGSTPVSRSRSKSISIYQDTLKAITEDKIITVPTEEEKAPHQPIVDTLGKGWKYIGYTKPGTLIHEIKKIRSRSYYSNCRKK